MASAAEQLAANLNFSALAKAEELKKRIWFTLGALLVYRFGTYIPLPGIDPSQWEQIFRTQAGGILGMFNMFAGGGIHRMAIFALNIMPYISASIIVQIFATVVPSLQSLRKEGESGRRKMTQYTRYLTVVLAAFQGFGAASAFQNQGVAIAPGRKQFTRTVGARAMAHDFVRLMTAALDGPYAACSRKVVPIPAREEILMIFPLCCFIMCLAAQKQAFIGPARLVCSVCAHEDCHVA